jgi:hypothetical protein
MSGGTTYLHLDPHALQGYRAAILVGHGELWSEAEQNCLDRFVAAGGNVAALTGDACRGRVAWDPKGKLMLCHALKESRGDRAEECSAERLSAYTVYCRDQCALDGGELGCVAMFGAIEPQRGAADRGHRLPLGDGTRAGSYDAEVIAMAQSLTARGHAKSGVNRGRP